MTKNTYQLPNPVHPTSLTSRDKIGKMIDNGAQSVGTWTKVGPNTYILRTSMDFLAAYRHWVLERYSELVVSPRMTDFVLEGAHMSSVTFERLTLDDGTTDDRAQVCTVNESNEPVNGGVHITFSAEMRVPQELPKFQTAYDAYLEWLPMGITPLSREEWVERLKGPLA